MRSKKVFVASSMNYQDWRNGVGNIINTINSNARGYRGIQYDILTPYIYGRTNYGDGTEDQQESINNEIKSCDIFLLLIKCGDKIGEKSLEEYNIACQASLCIKTFVICSNKDSKDKRSGYLKELSSYIDDSKRYISIIEDSEFDNELEKFIKDIIFNKLNFQYSQNELSYENHIKDTTQIFRKYDQSYYHRNIDDAISDLVNKSSLIILEGNTYSGKTRAVYELMINKKEWENHLFYVYKSGKCDNNDLNSININNNEVILIDDINSIIEGYDNIGNSGIWRLLREIKPNITPKWESTTIIITISGSLSQAEKINLYRKIFGESYYSLVDTLKNVTVNFDDLFSKEDFRLMVSEMVRSGKISKNQIRPGNYTIGSLFIDETEILNRIQGECAENPATIDFFKSLILYQMFSRVADRESREDILSVFCGIYNRTSDEFDERVESLRKHALIVANRERIIIDPFILDSISNTYNIQNTDIEKLINCVTNNNIQGIVTRERIGYLLCDRNNLSDDQIKFIIGCIYQMLYPNGQRDISILTKCINICNKENDNVYTYNFCATAISRLSNFDRIINFVNKLKNNFNHCSSGPICLKLYKNIIYNLLSSQKNLPYYQEIKVLGLIFNDNSEFNSPFCKEDLNEIITLRRLIPHINLSTDEILEIASTSKLLSGNQQENSSSDDMILIDDDEIEDGSIDNQTVLFSQIRKLCCCILENKSSFEEFKEILNKIEEKCEESNNLKNAISEYFSIILYKRTQSVIKFFDYHDKKSYGDFLIQIDDRKGVLNNLNLEDENIIQEHRIWRIKALNRLLKDLDENDSLELYKTMKDNGLKDAYTFSMLITNQTLGFEHLIHLYDNEEQSFLIGNQLLDKAPNKTEIRICMEKMQIPYLDPSYLKSEEALGSYIKKKDISYKECKNAIIRWKKRDTNSGKTFNAVTLGQITSKMPYEILKSIFEDENVDWLTDEEKKIIRENPICINHLFTKGRNKQNESDYLREKYNELSRNNSEILFNTDQNANDSIISPFIQNFYIHDNIENLISFVYNTIDNNNEHIYKPSQYIYRALLQRIVRDTKDKSTLIDMINDVHSKAFETFSKHYSRNDVLNKMSFLYAYRIMMVKQKDYNKKQKYFCSNRLIECNFYTYLDKVIENNIIVDNVFINEVLKGMNICLDEEVYQKIKQIAKKNNAGIVIDAVYSKEMANHIQNELIKISENAIERIDKDLILHYSPIKLLWWLLNKNKIRYKHAKKFLKDNPNIQETQTFMNIAFKAISNDKHLTDNEKINEINSLLKKLKGNNYLYFSMEMFLAALRVFNLKEINAIRDIIPKSYFNDYHALDAIMRKHIRLYKKSQKVKNTKSDIDILLNPLQEIIKSNLNNVNTTIINTYICALFVANESSTLDMIWNNLQTTNTIIINNEIIEGIPEKSFHANCQTYIYFPDRLSIVEIDEIFKGNFNYEEKKSCLYDAINNYKGYLEKSDAKIDLDYLKKMVIILERVEHQNIRQKIYNEYILKNHKNIDKFWFDMIKESDLMRDELSELYSYCQEREYFRQDRIQEIEACIDSKRGL